MAGIGSSRRVNNYMDQRYGKGGDGNGSFQASPSQRRRLEKKDPSARQSSLATKNLLGVGGSRNKGPFSGRYKNPNLSTSQFGS